MIKQITIDQFLTAREIDRAAELYTQLSATGRFAKTLEDEIITPNMERINQALGQENDPRYLAYAVEFIMMRCTRQPSRTYPHHEGPVQ